MNAKKLKVGVLGASFGASVHVPAFNAHERFTVVALASPHSAAAIAAERGIPHAFDGLEAMLAGCELDVLSVAAPPFAHYAAVSAGIARGLHILCEKPFALNLAQAEAMAAAAHGSSKAHAIAHEFRYIPARQALKELITNNHLGSIRQIEATMLGGWLRTTAQRRRWWFDRAHGGGIAGALLSHSIDTANWLAGRAPIRATGYVRTAIPERQDADGDFTATADDGAFALIEYDGGAIARVSADATVSVANTTVAVQGDTRAAAAAGAGFIETNLFTIDDDETAELETKPSKYARFESAHPNLPYFLELLDQFAARIDGEPSEAATFEDGLATQRVLAAIGYETPSLS